MLSLKSSLLFISNVHGIPCSHIHEIKERGHSHLLVCPRSTSGRHHTCLQQQHTEHTQKKLFFSLSKNAVEKKKEKKTKALAIAKLFALNANAIKRLKWPGERFHKKKEQERKLWQL